MPDEQKLMTLMQISDLHFGDVQGGSASAAQDPRVPPLLSAFPFLDGLLGHHYKALLALTAFYHSLGPQIPVIVTGDLTAHGATSQLTLADEFLGASKQVTNLGLGCQNWKDLAIPGNHDQWPGNGWIFGGPSPAFANFFGNPFPIMSGAGDIQLSNGV